MRLFQMIQKSVLIFFYKYICFIVIILKILAPPKFLNEMVKTYSSSNEILDFPLVIFMDSYPTSFGEGLGEGHREALKEFVEYQRKTKN